jgi:Flp pilus assembly pilin Flp
MLALISYLQVAFAALSGGVARRTATARGAGFLEYALLALAALAIFVLISTLFVPEMGNMFKRISETLKTGKA